MGLAENLAALAQQTTAADKANKQTLDAIISIAQERAVDTAGQAGAPTPATPAVARRLAGSNGNAGYHPGKGIPGGKLTTIESAGQKFTVAAGAAGAFKHFLDAIAAKGYKFHSNGGYVDRDIRGRPGVKSQHAYGRAIDINAESNPMRDDGKLVTDMPSWVPQIAKQYGLTWGGDWHSRKDPMHFEYDA